MLTITKYLFFRKIPSLNLKKMTCLLKNLIEAERKIGVFYQEIENRNLVLYEKEQKTEEF